MKPLHGFSWQSCEYGSSGPEARVVDLLRSIKYTTIGGPIITSLIRQAITTSFSKVHGFIVGLLGLVLSVGSWLIPIDQSSTVPTLTVFRWCVPAVAAVSIAFVVLIQALLSLDRLSRIPRVLNGRKGPTKTDGSSSPLLLLEKSELYGHDVVVSVYYVDESDFEELIGVGYVRNIQVDGKIQVLLEQVVSTTAEVIEKLTGNNAEVLRRIRVKPSAPHRYSP